MTAVFRSFSLGVILFLLTGCSQNPQPKPDALVFPPITHTFGQDSLHVFISGHKTHFVNPIHQDSLLFSAGAEILNHKLLGFEDTSLRQFIREELRPEDVTHLAWLELSTVIHDKSILTLDYLINYSSIDKFISAAVDKHYHNASLPIEPLFANSTQLPMVNDFQNTQLLLPCDSIPVPLNPLFLPNSPRNYRNGIHRGIDFQANWGTPIRAVADGIIIRADQHYEEISPSFLETILDHAELTGHTPSDLFNHILLGRAVIIDHGFNVVPGYRSISIHAHLSEIYPYITRGYEIKKGDYFGKVGNSGLMSATKGNQGGTHLHFEFIIQNKDGEYYLGQTLEYSPLIELLQSIFIN